jgi:hypothetical protein
MFKDDVLELKKVYVLVKDMNAYAIIRIDEYQGEDCPIECKIIVKSVVRDEKTATSEVERLNALGKEGVRYFSQATRLLEYDGAVYAIENDRENLLLVKGERCGGIDTRLIVINGGFGVKKNKDGSISPMYPPSVKNWKAYYLTEAPKMSGGYQAILEEALKQMRDC